MAKGGGKFEVTGVQSIIKNMMTAKGETAAGMERGLMKAGLALQRMSQKVVPVDTGALKASAATRKEGEGFRTKVTVSYGTDYGIYVHENLESRHAPGKIAKFLEKPARENADELAAIIRKEAQLKKGRRR